MLLCKHRLIAVTPTVAFDVSDVNGDEGGYHACLVYWIYSGSRLHDTQSGVSKPTEDVLGCDFS